ncbi:MAG TPA: zinc ABC transporter substrate-binding protein [Anaeromyxobacteraceae bacterium]|nr:zinc ABC transporter substrate-binding protein [Anaeromyxobacteraceae bacterium]
MRHLFAVLLLAAVAPSPARAALHVVTTTEGLAALAREVAGDGASVESLSRGTQDPHFVDANPILALKLRGADLLVDVGLDLEIGWLPPLVTQSRNARIQPGGPGRLTAASAVTVLDVPTGPVDRSVGDLHPAGNPHFLADPRRAVRVAGAIAERLAALDPGGAAAYRGRAAAFAKRMDAALARWGAALAPLKGRAVFTHHRTLVYFLDWAGLRSDGEMEPRPGTPPPPAHLADLVQRAKRDGVRACLVEGYYDPRSDALVARLSGAKLVVLPGDVGGDPAASGYERWIDLLVGRVAEALR